MAIPPNDWVDILTDNIRKDNGLHTAGGSVIMTRDRNPGVCYICGINHYSNKCKYRDKSDTRGKEEE